MTMTRSEWIDYARAHLEVRHATQNGAYRAGRTIRPEAVSYTHLTLPTIVGV